MSQLFNAQYIDPRVVYALFFNRLPVMGYVNEIDPVRGFELVRTKMKDDILEMYQHYYFDHAKAATHSHETIFVLRKDRMIVQGGECFHVFHAPGDYNWADDLMKGLSAFRKEGARPAIGFNRSVSAK